MSELSSRLSQSVQAVREKWSGTPRVGIILGSGLGGLCEFIETEVAFENDDIPHYPKAAALGHRGRFLCGRLHEVSVVVMDGRTHLYEGVAARELAHPIRIMLQLGIEILVISNACGAVNPEFQVGDVVILNDHINLMWKNPLIGKNDDSSGPRFPDMSSPYDSELADAARVAADRVGFRVRSGVYLGLSGPNYETSAEYRMARFLGADIVGMSTIPEVLTARHGGARVFAASVVSNVQSAASGPVTGQEVVDVVARSEPVLRELVTGVVENIRNGSARVSGPAQSGS